MAEKRTRRSAAAAAQKIIEAAVDDDEGNQGDAGSGADSAKDKAQRRGTAAQQRVLVPKFLTKAFQMVDEKANSEYVGWNEEGNVVVIRRLHGFAERILPKYYKHCNYSSFVRQLNMYGFTRADMPHQSFKHPLFLRGHPENLALIKRKTSVPKAKNTAAAVVQQKKELDRLLEEVKTLRTKQQEFDLQVFDLQSNNEHLEKENVQLWQAINEAGRRQQLMVKRMKQMMGFMYYIYKEEGKRLPEVAQVLPKLLQAAKDCGVEIDPTEVTSPAALLGMPSFSSSSASASAATPIAANLHDFAANLRTPAGRGAFQGSDAFTQPSPVSGSNALTRGASARGLPLLTQGDSGKGNNNDLMRMDTVGTINGFDLLDAPGSASPLRPDAISEGAPEAAVPMKQPPPSPGLGVRLDDEGADAAALMPSADPLTRNVSLQSFMDAMEKGGKDGSSFGKYDGLARGISQYINDQDDTLRRLESLSSTFSNPLVDMEGELDGNDEADDFDDDLDDMPVPPPHSNGQAGGNGPRDHDDALLDADSADQVTASDSISSFTLPPDPKKARHTL